MVISLPEWPPQDHVWRLDGGSNLLRLFTYTSMTLVFWAKFGLWALP